jgi:hypothetical protein
MFDLGADPRLTWPLKNRQAGGGITSLLCLKVIVGYPR